MDLDEFVKQAKERNPHEPEFQQAVEEFASSLAPALERHPEFCQHRILERVVEPERMIQFRVTWLDDQEQVQVNRGWRVQFNCAIGPYKGGLRFHPTVNLSVLKFLGFEQIFKNALTTLPLGGGKGGSDFDPKGRSDFEVMRFCQAFMLELARHVGEDTDVPAGDIGVGAREIGYLYGMYRKLTNRVTGVLTGKGITWGGSNIRPEATGYGAVYFALHALADQGEDLEGKVALISGSGNVAIYAAEKVLQSGGKVLTLSDSSGWIHAPEGLVADQLAELKQLKFEERGRLSEFAEAHQGVSYSEEGKVWQVEGAQLAFPCATHNELEEADARDLIANGVGYVIEGANMPCTADAVHALQDAGVTFGPGKAANAGGVATSGLEMAQNSQRTSWSRQEVDQRLHSIMENIYRNCADTAERYGKPGDLAAGANIAGFVKVATAMIEQGIV